MSPIVPLLNLLVHVRMMKFHKWPPEAFKDQMWPPPFCHVMCSPRGLLCNHHTTLVDELENGM